MPEKMAFSLPISKHSRTPLEVASHAALEAGKILLERLDKPNKTTVKGKRNLVTEADFLSEKKVMGILAEEYPDHGILSEESGASGEKAEYTWIIDPLDGTNNYHFGIPYFCVNIALARSKEVLLGITYDPVRDEMFHAVKGGGVRLNSRKIGVTEVASLKDASFGVDLGYNPEQSDNMLDTMVKLWPRVHCLRLLGSASLGLAYVACSRLSLYFHRFLYPWDTASGLLLVREAGGQVLNSSGKPAGLNDSQLVASNHDLLAEYFKALNQG